MLIAETPALDLADGIRPGAKYEQVAVNSMGETVMATPAISDGTLFIRGARHLFAVRR